MLDSGYRLYGRCGCRLHGRPGLLVLVLVLFALVLIVALLLLFIVFAFDLDIIGSDVANGYGMSLLLSEIKRCGKQSEREQGRQGTRQALAEVVSGSAVMVSHVDQCVVNSPVGRIAVRVCLQPGYSSNLSGWQGKSGFR